MTNQSPPIAIDRLCFGTEQLGGTDWGMVSQMAIIGAVRKAWELGVTRFDTAPAYGIGESERALAKALGEQRSEATIATKGGLTLETRAGQRALVTRDASRTALEKGADESLGRLRIEQIPLFFLHWPEPGRSITEIVMSLEYLRSKGKIGRIGLSNINAAQLTEAMSAGRIDAVQVSLSLLGSPQEEVIRRAAEEDVEVWVYGVLGQGLLSGKYMATDRFDETDRRHRLPQFEIQAIKDRESLLRTLKEISVEIEVSMAATSTRYALDYPGVTRVIVGIKGESQLLDATTALTCHLSAAQFDRLRKFSMSTNSEPSELDSSSRLPNVGLGRTSSPGASSA